MTTTEKDEITIEDLPEKFRDVAELLGMENAMKLVDFCGGDHVYVPKRNMILKPSKYRDIYDEYKSCKDTDGYRRLSQKYDLTVNRIREIVREEHRRRYPPPEQTNLF